MGNLTADRKSIRKDGTLFAHPVAASTTIYAGALVSLDASGNAVPSSDTATDTFAGKADMRADNASGSAGDVTLEGHREGVFEFNAVGMAQADTNDDAYVVDDNTVGKGILAQPTNVTGVALTRIPTSRGGTYALAYTNTGTTLAWGGGSAIDVSASGDFTLTAPDGSQILATVTAGSLPGSDQSDNIQLRYLKCGRIAEVASATSVYIDILTAVRA